MKFVQLRLEKHSFAAPPCELGIAVMNLWLAVFFENYRGYIFFFFLVFVWDHFVLSLSFWLPSINFSLEKQNQRKLHPSVDARKNIFSMRILFIFLHKYMYSLILYNLYCTVIVQLLLVCLQPIYTELTIDTRRRERMRVHTLTYIVIFQA